MTTTTARYTVSVLVNDEVEDPTFREFETRTTAVRVAEGYVVNAQENGWELVKHATPTSWKLTDDDGDRIHVVVQDDTDA